MKSKIFQATKTLYTEGPISLVEDIKNYVTHPRDREREIGGPAANLYDCFIFYKELELLELRLNELDDIVDYFVIVEAIETFQGDKKPLYFKQNKERFSEFNNKIIHHVVQYPDRLEDTWEREHYLRDSIQEALREKAEIKRQDEILISDIDEIPDPNSMQSALSFGGIKVFALKNHHYYYNSVETGMVRWLGPVMSEYKHFTSGQDFRVRYPRYYEDEFTNVRRILLEVELSVKNLKKVRILPDAGWHFSYLGDVDFIIDKIETFSHDELNKPEYKNEESIRTAISKGRSLFDYDNEFEIVEIDDSYPEYILQNRLRFSENIADVSE